MKKKTKDTVYLRQNRRQGYAGMNGKQDQNTDTAGRNSRKPTLKKRWLLIAVAVPALILLVFSIVNLVRYMTSYLSSRATSKELQAAYYAPVETEEIIASPSLIQTESPTPLPSVAPLPTSLPKMVLDAQNYTSNPHLQISSRFQKLQDTNKDIIGWLNIPGTLDEAVVQRNNTYYLKRDYKGYHNSNGALFLDENCNLKTRPYTFLIYGHNMKTGAMFGCLHKYDSLTYYKSNPWITFDTVYEAGRYIVFSAGSMSTEKGRKNYLDFSLLNSNTIVYREKALEALQKLSVFSGYIDVQPDDQLLLLVTCSGDETERRFVAARRIREGEDENKLLYDVNRAWKK